MRIDTHLHIYADPARGLFEIENFPIVEYGEKAHIPLAGVGGSVDEALAALDAAGFDYATVLGSYEVPGYPDLPPGRDHWPTEPVHGRYRDDLVAYNRWVCRMTAPHERLIPFVSANPAVMTSDDAREHLGEAFSDWGARGLKLHPIGIRAFPDDPGFEGVYDACIEADVPIVFHSGPDTRGRGFSEPRVFADLAARRPDLRLVLAHLGGGSWRDTLALAEARPQLMFDLSEIVIWIGATAGPTAEEVAGLIRGIGVERVVTGSDFPWYTPAVTAAIVERLPGFSDAECDLLLGENAARLLKLG
ncbi:amidohydrolase family protein [Microbacterium sp. 18062]|uniref:amidohydrolase family protein n=1 Tax=Microbacterium sp. 18062 TaxID=2681410 RepID=UPI00135BFCD6|nr:amidohydrolase family protein [Microbacterium sp. 18062]